MTDEVPRGDWCWPMKDLVKSGADVAIGTDWPAIALSQALTLEEALPLYTINPARTMGFGAVTGSIEPGKSAFFSVLDRDIFSIEAIDIAEMHTKAQE